MSDYTRVGVYQVSKALSELETYIDCTEPNVIIPKVVNVGAVHTHLACVHLFSALEVPSHVLWQQQSLLGTYPRVPSSFPKSGAIRMILYGCLEDLVKAQGNSGRRSQAPIDPN